MPIPTTRPPRPPGRWPAPPPRATASWSSSPPTATTARRPTTSPRVRRSSTGAAREAQASAAALGLHRVAWLGYADSGMTGWEQNPHEGVLPPRAPRRGRRPVRRAARRGGRRRRRRLRLARRLRPPRPRQGPPRAAPRRRARRAAQPAGARVDDEPRRDAPPVRGGEGRRARPTPSWDPDQPMDDGNPLGSPSRRSTWQVDVSALARAAPRGAARRTRARPPTSGICSAMPRRGVRALLRPEHYIEPGREPGMRRGWIFED